MRSIVVALGDPEALAGFQMAGVRVLAAREPDEVLRAWSSLPTEVGLVILTQQAAAAVPDLARAVSGPLVAVMPL